MFYKLSILLLTIFFCNDSLQNEDKSCTNFGEECLDMNECPELLQDYRRFKTLTIKSQDYTRLKDRLRSSVCNSSPKKFCCKKSVAVCDKLPSTSKGQCLSSSPELILDGEETKPGEFPFIASIGITETKEKYFDGHNIKFDVPRFYCGGTLINEYFVLTAAHCINDQISTIRLGEHKFSVKNELFPPVQDFHVKFGENTIVHEGYSKQDNRFINDIALIKLPRPAKINKGVHPVCLNSNVNLENLNLTVAGWGFTENFGNPSDILLKLNVPVLTSQECTEKWDEGRTRIYPRDDQICAGGEVGKNACRGDSGGPLFYNKPSEPFYVTGIVSYGHWKCGNGNPAIYTRVESYVPWIKAKIQESCTF